MRTRTMTAAGLLALLTVTGCASGSGVGVVAPAPGAASGSASPTAAATVDGNGIAALDADQISAKARAAFLAAPTVHLKGNVRSAGSTIGLDLMVRRSGGGTGTITMDGGKVRLLLIGKVAYLSGDPAFWKRAGFSASATRALTGKYMKAASSDKDLAELLDFYDLPKLAENLLPPAGMQVSGRETVGGQRVMTLTDGSGARYSVALDGPAYPVRLAGKDGTDMISMDFLDYGKPVPLAAPPASRVIDVSRLG